DAYREVPVNETFHEQTDNELSEKELKHVKVADITLEYTSRSSPEESMCVDSSETVRKLNVRNPNELIVVSGIANQNLNGNGNVVATRAEGNINGNNGNQIRCYNYRGLGHLARNCTVLPKVTSVEQEWGTIEQHSAIVKETAYHESLFHNLAAEVEKVNSVKRKMKETNDELTTELATYKNKEKCMDMSNITRNQSKKRTRERMSDQEAKEIKSRSQRDHASAFFSQLQLNHSQPKPTPLF
ncbi:hypothetical protein Tco_0755281, partial [Tanacetum coccineum]